MTGLTIAQRVKRVLASIPRHVLLVAAAKTRSPEEVRAAIDAGVAAVGYNYVQEAERVIPAIERAAGWHLIGHLQRNKARRAAAVFDMIETIDSLRVVSAVDRHCADIGKDMPVLIEINSGRESNKTGVVPDEAEGLIEQVAALQHIRVQGLMTMGPRFGNPDDARPYFRLTKGLFDRLAASNLPNVEMRYLSMGMSNTYRVTVQEGANMVRIGTLLFSDRCE